MKDFIFILGLVFFIIIALKFLFWALSHVITIVVVAAIVYVIVRVMDNKKQNRGDT